MNDDINWDDAVNAREAVRPAFRTREQQIDLEVTKILGKPVLKNDQRLIQTVVRFKKEHGNSPEIDRMDNYLYNPDFLVELRKAFA